MFEINKILGKRNQGTFGNMVFKARSCRTPYG